MLDEVGAHIRREKDIARKLRQTRWWQQKRANAVCYYCNVPLSASSVTMDHVVALRLGGRSTKDNIVVCCLSCNRQKKDDYMVDWFKTSSS